MSPSFPEGSVVAKRLANLSLQLRRLGWCFTMSYILLPRPVWAGVFWKLLIDTVDRLPACRIQSSCTLLKAIFCMHREKRSWAKSLSRLRAKLYRPRMLRFEPVRAVLIRALSKYLSGPAYEQSLLKVVYAISRLPAPWTFSSLRR